MSRTYGSTLPLHRTYGLPYTALRLYLLTIPKIVIQRVDQSWSSRFPIGQGQHSGTESIVHYIHSASAIPPKAGVCHLEGILFCEITVELSVDSAQVRVDSLRYLPLLSPSASPPAAGGSLHLATNTRDLRLLQAGCVSCPTHMNKNRVIFNPVYGLHVPQGEYPESMASSRLVNMTLCDSNIFFAPLHHS